MQKNPQETSDRLLLSVCEVAKLLGIGRNLAYELVRENKLPHIRLGRRIFIPREALQKWLWSESGLHPSESGR